MKAEVQTSGGNAVASKTTQARVMIYELIED